MILHTHCHARDTGDSQEQLSVSIIVFILECNLHSGMRVGMRPRYLCNFIQVSSCPVIPLM